MLYLQAVVIGHRHVPLLVPLLYIGAALDNWFTCFCTVAVFGGGGGLQTNSWNSLALSNVTSALPLKPELEALHRYTPSWPREMEGSVRVSEASVKMEEELI